MVPVVQMYYCEPLTRALSFITIKYNGCDNEESAHITGTLPHQVCFANTNLPADALAQFEKKALIPIEFDVHCPVAGRLGTGRQ